MVITLDAELEAALKAAAEKQGVAPEALALKTLGNIFVPRPLLEPRDEWERQLRSIATDCGVSLSDEALSRESIYTREDDWNLNR